MIFIISIIYLVTFAILMYAASEVVYQEVEACANISRPILYRHRRNHFCLY